VDLKSGLRSALSAATPQELLDDMKRAPSGQSEPFRVGARKYQATVRLLCLPCRLVIGACYRAARTALIPIRAPAVAAATAGGGGTGGRRRRRQEREVHRSAYGNLAHPPAGAGAPERAGHRDRQGAARRAIIAPRCSAVALRRSEVAALTDGRFSGGFTLEAKAAARHANAATAVGVGPAISDRVSWRFSRGCRRGGAWWGGAARPSASRSGETRLKADR